MTNQNTKSGDSVSIPLEKFGVPGMRGTLFLIEGPDEVEAFAGNPRRFEVTIELNTAPAFAAHGIQWGDDLTGDSPLISPAAKSLIEAEIAGTGQSIRAEFIRNTEGRLAHARVDAGECTYLQAYHTAQDCILPLLSKWAFEYDVPILVGRILVRDPKSGSCARIYENPHAAALLSKDRADTPVEYQAVFSLYREGLCTGSVFYQFLCFYKIIDYINTTIKPAQRKLAAQQDSAPAPKSQKLRIPNQPPFDHPQLEPYIGKSCSVFVESVLTPARNEIAHALLDDRSQPVVLDRAETAERFNALSAAARGQALRALRAGLDRDAGGARAVHP